MKKHVVISIRYSLYAPDMRKSWAIGRESEEKYKKELFSYERMSRRRAFFERVTLDSLINLNASKPEDVELKVYILSSRLLPESDAKFLNEVSANHKFLDVIYLNEDEVDVRAGLIEYVDRLSGGDIYASVRLDDDDGLAADFVNQLNFYLRADFSGCVVSFSKGHGCLLDDAGAVLNAAEYKWRFGSAGLAYVSKKDKAVRTGTYSIFQCGDHTKTDNKLPTVSDARRPAFLRAFHVENDSKDSFENCVGRVLPLGEISAALGLYGVKTT